MNFHPRWPRDHFTDNACPQSDPASLARDSTDARQHQALNRFTATKSFPRQVYRGDLAACAAGITNRQFARWEDNDNSGDRRGRFAVCWTSGASNANPA
ncbi:MAG: hypothetical protein SH868_11910 [Bythopirellula sp.]|nr:hypothetical protein [Bythopirellula sp.]